MNFDNFEMNNNFIIWVRLQPTNSSSLKCYLSLVTISETKFKTVIGSY